MAQHIIVTDYNPLWPKLFEAEAAKIREILGDNCLELHHIGSTSVKGLAAKPIIDIMPVVKDIEAVDRQAAAFGVAGYEYMGEFGIPGRRYLRKGGDERTCHVHIFGEKSRADIERHLAVRDYLRSHEEAAAAYGALKRGLALQYPWDNEGYCDGKDGFVKELEARALEWKQKNGS